MSRDRDPSYLLSRVDALEAALQLLIIEAHRLCDRQLGGTYADDCRQAIGTAVAILGRTSRVQGSPGDGV